MSHGLNSQPSETVYQLAQFVPWDSRPPSTDCDPGSDNLNLENCLVLDPNNPSTSVGDVYDTPATLVNVIANNIFILAGIIGFFTLIYAGYIFIMKGREGIQDARKIITSLIVGVIVMLSAYWILQIVQILTGIDNVGII